MREHEYYQELMSRLLDEGLAAEEEAALREHVRVCPECRQMFAAFTGMTAALREDLDEPPRDLARGVMERIRDEEPTFSPRRKTAADRKTIRSWIRLSAAACLVLIAAGAATVALRGPAKDAQTETASAGAADMAQAQTRYAGAAEGTAEQSANGSSGDGGAVSGLEDVPMTVSESMEKEAAADVGAPAPEPSAQEPLPVYDAARSRVGTIAPENIPAFEALITDEGWAEGSFEYLLKVQYRQKTYAFATDGDGGLVWWEEPSTQPLRSSGTLADLNALITMDPPALPQ